MERVIDGYIYHVSRRVRNITYLKCKFSRRGCPATGKTSNPGGFIPINNRHTCHAARHDLLAGTQFRGALRTACQRSFRPVKEIYDEIILDYPAAQRRYPFSRMRLRMVLWQNNIELPHINSFRHFGVSLRAPRARQYFEYNNNGRMVICTSNHTAVFGDHQLLNEIENDNILYIGGTKTIAVNHLLGATSILCFIQQHRNHGIPIGTALLRNENEDNYSNILDRFFDNVAPDINPEIIYSNFDITLYLAIQNKFPESEIKFSFLPFLSDVLFNARLHNIDINDVNILTYIKKIIATTLLPPVALVDGYLVVKREIVNNHVIGLDTFLQHFEQNWIRTVGPQNLSFFGDLNAFNDAADGYWRMMRNKINTINDTENIWNLSRMIFNNNLTYKRSIQRLNENRPVSGLQRVRSVVNTGQLNRVWASWESNNLQLDRFLEISSSFFDQLILDLIHRDELEAQNEFQFIEGDDRFNYDNLLWNAAGLFEHVDDPAEAVVELPEREERGDLFLEQAGGPAEVPDDDDGLAEDPDGLNEMNACAVGPHEEARLEPVELLEADEHAGGLAEHDEDPEEEAANIDYVAINGICRICLDHSVEWRYLPCRHVIGCKKCTQKWQQTIGRSRPWCFVCEIYVELEELSADYQQMINRSTR